MELTKTGEEYLKAIYLLSEENEEIRVTDIAEKLNKTKATVNYNVANLTEMGLIEHETYGNIHLTEEGKKRGRKILEAYDIVYLFLNGILQIEPSKAEEEANKMKATLDDETLNSLARYTHKTLGLHSLDCGYDLNKESCRACARRKNTK